MQLFYGTVTFDSAAIDTQNGTTAKGHVSAYSDRGVDTPITIRAYGQTGTRLLNIKPKTRIQVTQGRIHRGDNYSYVLQVDRYSQLPDALDTSIYPDWHEIVLAGRSVKDLDKSDSRMYFRGADYTVIKRGLAVNQGKDKVDFFDVSVYSGDDDRLRKTDLIENYAANKGAYLMVRGVLNSRRGNKPGEDGTKPIFTDISVNQLFLGPKTTAAPAAPESGPYKVYDGSQGNGHGYTNPRPQEYVAAPAPGAQPMMPDDTEVPF